jgi:hypothetical protein
MTKYSPFVICASFFLSVWVSASAQAEPPAQTAQKSLQGEKSKARPHAKKRNLSNGNEEKALAILMQRKEVIEWLKAFVGPDNKSAKTGGHAIWRFDGHDGDVYTIQGVEVMEDHEVTFGWYHVNVRTRAITKEN